MFTQYTSICKYYRFHKHYMKSEISITAPHHANKDSEVGRNEGGGFGLDKVANIPSLCLQGNETKGRPGRRTHIQRVRIARKSVMSAICWRHVGRRATWRIRPFVLYVDSQDSTSIMSAIYRRHVGRRTSNSQFSPCSFLHLH